MTSRFNRKLEFSSKYTDQFDLAESALMVADEITAELNRLELTTDTITPYQASLVAAFFKCSNCLSATVLLANDGFTEDGRTIVRKMIELFISLKYLSDDMKSRIDKYVWHEAVSKYFTAKRYIDEPDYSSVLHSGFTAAMPKIKSDYDSAKKFFKLDKDGEVAGKFRFNWSGKTIPKMALASKVAEIYAQYDLFSISVHASVRDVHTYFDATQSIFHWAVNVDEVPSLIMKAIEMQLALSKLLCKELSCDPKSKLRDLRNRWQEIDAKMKDDIE